MSKKAKKRNVKKILFLFVCISLLISTVFTIIRLIFAPSDMTMYQEYQKLKSDYVLTLLQCMVGLFALMLPSVLNRRWQITLPNNMIILYVIFLYCAIYLGEVRSFYYAIAHWDTMLHTFSGAMLGALGFSVVSLLNDSSSAKIQLSPLFVALFAFCFAVALGVVWEIYEYGTDTLLRTNMQKFMLENGTLLAGRAALNDTMKDLIVDTLGALVMSVIGYLSIARDPKWLDKFEIKKTRASSVQDK